MEAIEGTFTLGEDYSTKLERLDKQITISNRAKRALLIGMATRGSNTTKEKIKIRKEYETYLPIQLIQTFIDNNYTETTLSAMKGMGRKSIKEIKDAINIIKPNYFIDLEKKINIAKEDAPQYRIIKEYNIKRLEETVLFHLGCGMKLVGGMMYAEGYYHQTLTR